MASEFEYTRIVHVSSLNLVCGQDWRAYSFVIKHEVMYY